MLLLGNFLSEDVGIQINLICPNQSIGFWINSNLIEEIHRLPNFKYTLTN